MTIQTSGDVENGTPYKRGCSRFLGEWFWGLVIMTAPAWGLIAWKYLFLYLYFKCFDTLIQFDFVSLSNYALFFYNEFWKLISQCQKSEN